MVFIQEQLRLDTNGFKTEMPAYCFLNPSNDTLRSLSGFKLTKTIS
jgi:hypothetical protein